MHEAFFFYGEIPEIALKGNYTPFLVFLSYVVASFSSFTGLTLAHQMQGASPHAKNILHIGGAFAFGAGIWSMHFVGMLAYHMGMPMTYDPLLTILSLLIAIFSAAGFLTIARASRINLPLYLAGALLLGFAICGMHYTGMAAMKMCAMLGYVPSLFWLSVAIAVTASGAALWIIFALGRKSQTHQFKLRIIASLIMGLAIWGMHFTGMLAAVLIPVCQTAPSYSIFDLQGSDSMGLLIAIITSIVLGMALAAGLYKKERYSRDVVNDIPLKPLSLSLALTLIIITWCGWNSFTTYEAISNNITAETASYPDMDIENVGTVNTESQKILSELATQSYGSLYLIIITFIFLFTTWVFAYRSLNRWKEELIRARNESSSSNQAKSAFLANMSHEIRTPLNGIIGLTRMLSESKLDGEQKKSVQAVLNSSESLLLLLNDILDFSKIEAGEFRLEETPFNIQSSVKNIIDLLSPIATDKGLIVEFHYDHDLPTTVIGDPLRINQIIMNLVGNAIKFTMAGKVTISVSGQRMSYNQYNFNFIIEDTGIGIPKDVQQHVFKKFSQGDTSMTRKFGGSGLGLAIAKNLTELMKGMISFESTFNVGTKFIVSIPFTVTSETTMDHSPAQARIYNNQAEFSRYRILVVDDHPVNMLFAQKILSKMGFMNIDETVTGAEALQKIDEGIHYDAILMDCQMPGMDGFETTRHIREKEKQKGGHVPIIAMTANAMEGDRDLCLRAGMDDYLSKPVNPDRLHEVLLQWLVTRHSSSAAISGTENIVYNTNKTIIDLPHLELFTDGSSKLEKIIADTFLKVSDEALLVLKDCVRGARTNDAWKSTIHKLKGSSGQIGANILLAICKNAEENPNCSREEKALFVAEIEAALNNVRVFFKNREE